MAWLNKYSDTHGTSRLNSSNGFGLLLSSWSFTTPASTHYAGDSWGNIIVDDFSNIYATLANTANTVDNGVFSLSSDGKLRWQLSPTINDGNHNFNHISMLPNQQKIYHSYCSQSLQSLVTAISTNGLSGFGGLQLGTFTQSYFPKTDNQGYIHYGSLRGDGYESTVAALGTLTEPMSNINTEIEIIAGASLSPIWAAPGDPVYTSIVETPYGIFGLFMGKCPIAFSNPSYTIKLINLDDKTQRKDIYTAVTDNPAQNSPYGLIYNEDDNNLRAALYMVNGYGVSALDMGSPTLSVYRSYNGEYSPLTRPVLADNTLFYVTMVTSGMYLPTSWTGRYILVGLEALSFSGITYTSQPFERNFYLGDAVVGNLIVDGFGKVVVPTSRKLYQYQTRSPSPKSPISVCNLPIYYGYQTALAAGNGGEIYYGIGADVYQLGGVARTHQDGGEVLTDQTGCSLTGTITGITVENPIISGSFTISVTGLSAGDFYGSINEYSYGILSSTNIANVSGTLDYITGDWSIDYTPPCPSAMELSFYFQQYVDIGPPSASFTYNPLNTQDVNIVYDNPFYMYYNSSLGFMILANVSRTPGGDPSQSGQWYINTGYGNGTMELNYNYTPDQGWNLHYSRPFHDIGTDPVGYPITMSYINGFSEYLTAGTDGGGSTFILYVSCIPSVSSSLSAFQFIDTSIAPFGFPVTGWSWDFGNGNTSILQNPTASYNDASCYNVTLTAYNAGGYSIASDIICISEWRAPIASFTWLATSVSSVIFTDTSIAPYPIDTWSWDLGNGETSNLQNPTGTFSALSCYTVSLTVCNIGGCSIATQQVCNDWAIPVASFSATPSGTYTIPDWSYLPVFEPEIIQFTSTSTSTSGFPIISWNWDLGNGTTSNVQNPTALYTDVGCYIVSLTTCNILACATTSAAFCVNYWPDMLYFSEIPPAAEATSRSKRFELTLYSTTTTDHVIQLYSQYSRSAPYQTPQNKWSHIVPQWNFEDADGNYIESVGTSDDYIYSNGHVIGTSGTAEFYYRDDMPSLAAGFPVILWATSETSGISVPYDNEKQQLPGYANSMVVTYLPYYINGIAPEELHITRNGIDPLSSSVYWINQKIPNMITVHGDTSLISKCGSDGLSMIFDYPSSNALGTEMGAINKKVVTFSDNDQTWTSLENGTSSSYFQTYDAQGFSIGGYVRNTVVTDLTSLNTYISAGANIKYATPYRDSSFVWISNPNNNIFNRLHYPTVDTTIITAITSWLHQLPEKKIDTYNTPYLVNKPNVMGLTGFGGIYGIAVDQCYNVWCTDGEMDKIYKFSYNGEILSSIDLNDDSLLASFGVSGGCTPAGLSLDSVSGMWVTLFDSSSVLKFDRMTGQVMKIINPEGNQDQYLDGIGVDMDFKPTIAETDRNDNVWVSYTNSLCSYLYKYDTNGNELLTVTLPTCSNPMDIVVDYNNDIWVTLTKHAGPPYLNGSVIKVGGVSGTILSSFNATHPEYITMDRVGNIWYTHNFNSIGNIKVDGSQNTYVIGVSTVPNWYAPSATMAFNALEGIASDSADRIWIINSYESRIYLLSGDPVINSFELYSTPIDWYLDTNLNVITVSTAYSKNLQAFGDWTGTRFFQKYFSFYPQTCTVYLTGQSSLFDIDDFNGYDVRKFNESWDTTTQIRDYALPEHLYNNNNLFVNYIGTMVGGLETSANSIGRKIYERTANFVANHNDIDTCNIDKIYSLANEINVPIDDYNFTYPADLKRLMDIVSIPHKQLWGDRCKCGLNFKSTYNYCDNCGHKHDSNRGDTLDTDNYVVSSNVPFIAEYKFQRNVYELINPLTSSTNIFNSASSYLLSDPYDYCYYEYLPTVCNVQNEGVINWEDEYTTLNEGSSGLNEWYGRGELVEKMLNYIIHKGLGF